MVDFHDDEDNENDSNHDLKTGRMKRKQKCKNFRRFLKRLGNRQLSTN